MPGPRMCPVAPLAEEEGAAAAEAAAEAPAAAARRPAAVTVKVSPSLPPYSDLCGSSEHLLHRFHSHLRLFQ